MPDSTERRRLFRAADIPNLICVARIILVWPIVVALIDGRYALALLLILVAGASDGLDGFLAKRFSWQSRLGGLLDPLADKLLLVSVFVALSMTGLVPVWLTAVVIIRDLVIVSGGVVYQWLVEPVQPEPSVASKINTGIQLLYVLAVIGNRTSGMPPPEFLTIAGAGSVRDIYRQRSRLRGALVGSGDPVAAPKRAVMQQLPLEVRLADHAVFDSFYAAGNELLVHQLQLAATTRGYPPLWLSAPSGHGKSHLLQAAVALADQNGRRAVYLPLGSLPALPAGVLEGLGSLDLVCLDDLHAVAGQPEWEIALFGLYEELRGNGSNLVVATEVMPAELVFGLPDLASRLKSGTTFRLQALDDEGRLRALQMRARFRGFELPDETGRYLLARVERGIAGLFHLLDELDRAALVAQKRLTIPFVRQVLGS